MNIVVERVRGRNNRLIRERERSDKENPFALKPCFQRKKESLKKKLNFNTVAFITAIHFPLRRREPGGRRIVKFRKTIPRIVV